MPIRYNVRPRPRLGVPGLPTGYDGKSASDLSVPAVGIEDVDLALFRLLDVEIPFQVAGDGSTMRDVPVIMAAGEKWALQKRSRAFRDRNNSLILPLITAVRTVVMQSSDGDVTGRGINQQTGEIVIYRRLDKSDRGYQQLVNRLLLQHQQNLAVGSMMADVGQLTTLRDVGDLSVDPVVKQGGLLVADRRNNVFETIVVPAPQFFTALYDVTIWTQYTVHMNQLLEQLVSSFLSQGNCWRLDSPKGYWFVATVDANTYTSETNVDDYSDAERVIKYKFVVKVPGYIMASQVPGAPVAIKRYVSSPTIDFSIAATGDSDDVPASVGEPFLGSDDPTLPLDPGDDAPPRRRDGRATGATRLYPPPDDINPDDPALTATRRGQPKARFKQVVGVDKEGHRVTSRFRVRTVNRFTGETVLSPDASLGGVSFVITEE